MNKTEILVFSLSLLSFSHRLSFFADAFTFLNVRLEKEVVSICNWNTNGASNSLMGICLFSACKSR